MKIFLTGYMGSGKTRTAEYVSRRLGSGFLDTDKVICEIAGMDMPTIFSVKGEKWFREMETRVLNNLRFAEKLVVATGGGLPCYGDNISVINNMGTSFYLKVPPQVILERLARDTNRPLLPSDSDKRAKYIRKHMRSREACYAQSNYCIDGSQSTEQIAAAIIARLKKPGEFV